MRKLFLVLGCLVACVRSAPAVDHPRLGRVRPNWAANLGPHVDAMQRCLELREAPRYVAFVEPLPSGATGVTTVDAYGAVEHCAIDAGEIVRREPATISELDIATARGALFALGPAQPIVPVGRVLEEVVDSGSVLGWLYWPEPADGDAGAAQKP
jgi:hypothetical protein